MNPPLDHAVPAVSNLEASLCTGFQSLIAFEEELSAALDESRELANMQGSPSDWNIGCMHHWDRVKEALHSIHQLEVKLRDAVCNSHSQGAWKTWEELLREEARLTFALSGLHSQALELNEAAAADWKKLGFMIESHRKIVQTNIQSLNVCLQSWTSQDQPDEVKHTEKEDTMNRPGAEGMDAVTYNKEFDHAAIEIGAEQHQALGLADVVKSLFMWVETPKERVLKNHDGALPQS